MASAVAGAGLEHGKKSSFNFRSVEIAKISKVSQLQPQCNPPDQNQWRDFN